MSAILNRMLESAIERKFRAGVIRLGGLSYKWVPTVKGLPDQIAILPGGEIWFVELKQSGLAPEPAQVAMHEKLRRRGARVITLAGPNEVDQWIRNRS